MGALVTFSCSGRLLRYFARLYTRCLRSLVPVAFTICHDLRLRVTFGLDSALFTPRVVPGFCVDFVVTLYTLRTRLVVGLHPVWLRLFARWFQLICTHFTLRLPGFYVYVCRYTLRARLRSVTPLDYTVVHAFGYTPFYARARVTRYVYLRLRTGWLVARFALFVVDYVCLPILLLPHIRFTLRFAFAVWLRLFTFRLLRCVVYRTFPFTVYVRLFTRCCS